MTGVSHGLPENHCPKVMPHVPREYRQVFHDPMPKPMLSQKCEPHLVEPRLLKIKGFSRRSKPFTGRLTSIMPVNFAEL